ncbi:MAG: N-acetylmuramoyl-L-alanine amidase [Prevotella sp.]|nr:N-acetylmuramoyl-L-alanine amidase [Prevotella sp.]MBQ8714845.1 N-acetylmuramoyl-L-alanine amidase [Prevotella sp.]
MKKNRILVLIWVTMVFAVVSMAANKKFTLVIDAGHGGHDAGALGSFSKEKNINLNVALAFGRYVENNCPDVKVIYTRKTDVFIPLHTRADIANRNKADLFVSIHTNALPRGRIARGLETYTLGMHRAGSNLEVAKRENSVILIEKDYKQRYEGFDPNSSESYIMFEFMQDKNMAQSVELAKFVQKRVCAAARRPDKGVKQAGFLVLRETSMPSCLIELGFITTSDEEQMLNSKDGIDRLGYGIYQAFLDYKRKYDGRITVPYQAEQKEDINIPSVVPQEEQPETVKTTVPVKIQKEPAVPPVNVEVVKEEQAQVQSQDSTLIFKVQIMASASRQRIGKSKLYGQEAKYYEEGGFYKYTVGESEDYDEIAKIRERLVGNFPEAFVIAFRGGQKVDTRTAIREFRSNKKTKE